LDPKTLDYYAISAGLSFSLSLILMAFAHFQQGTVLVRRFAVAILMLAVAFFGGGLRPVTAALDDGHRHQWIAPLGRSDVLHRLRRLLRAA
jgi:hypothetical protein